MGSADSHQSHKPPLPEHLLEFAREMRSDSTDAESRLWRLLRSRRLGGFKFRRQVPIGNYILDFYCHEGKLVVEADDGQHSAPLQAARDEERSLFLRRQGIRVLRFWDNDVLKHTDAVRKKIYRELTEGISSEATSTNSAPHPSPLPEGEGVREDSRGARANGRSSKRDMNYR